MARKKLGELLAWLKMEAMKKEWVGKEEFNKKREEIVDGDPEEELEYNNVKMTVEAWDALNWEQVQRDLWAVLSEKTDKEAGKSLVLKFVQKYHQILHVLGPWKN